MDNPNFSHNDHDREVEKPAHYWESYEASSISSSHLKSLFSQNYTVNEREEYIQLKSKADEGDANARFLVGLCFERGKLVSKSYKKAFHYYKLAADQGNNYAQISLAMLYNDGLGTPQNFNQAFHYAKLATDQGNSSGYVLLGEFYAEGKGVEKSPEEALHFFQLADEQEHPLAWDYLAEAYVNGIGVEKSEEKADFYRQKAFNHHKSMADAGDPINQAIVGWFCENGIGTVKSIESAIHYYQLSAEQNCSLGQYYLAECHAYSKGIQKSSEKAIHFYKLAADQDETIAQSSLAQYLLENKINEDQAVYYLKLAIQKRDCHPSLLASCEYALAECFENGTGVKKSAQNALHYYRLSAEHGYELAQIRLGDAYLKGELGVKISPKKAVEFYKMAVDQGSSQSMMMLGQCYESGEGIEQSDTQAFHYYKLAADIDTKKGYSSAIFALGRCYELGIGTEKSFETAIYYYRLAAENGFVGGYFKAGCCYQALTGIENAKKAVAYFKLGAAENDPLSQHELAQAFEKGDGIEKSPSEAERYYALYEKNSSIKQEQLKKLDSTPELIKEIFKRIKSDADRGDVLSQFCVSEYYKNGEGVKQSDTQAFKYCKMSADRGYAEAQYFLGYYYKNGIGVEVSLENAFKYFKLAADQGESQAQMEVGLSYYHGFGIDQSYDEAVKYLKIPADQEVVEALYLMGHCYFSGDGVEESIEKAIELQEKAAKQDYTPSILALSEYYHYLFEIKKDLSLIKKAIEFLQKTIKQEDIKKYIDVSELEKKLSSWENILEKMTRTNYRQNARKIHNLPDDVFFYPDSKQIDASKFMGNDYFDIDLFKRTFNEYKDTACYLYELQDFNMDEIRVIRDAMLENPRLTFVGLKSDFYSLFLDFNRAGYGDGCLKRTNFRHNPESNAWFVMLFIG